MSDKKQKPETFQTELVEITDLHPHPKNYRFHPEDQLSHIIESIKEHGFYRNVVVAKDGTILAGHGVVEAAKKLGHATIPVIRLAIAPNSARALKVLAGDNEISRIAGIDDRALTELLKEIQGSGSLLGTGYDEQTLAALVMVTRPGSEIADFDAAAEWSGMPGYTEGQKPLRLIILFDDDAHRQEVLKILQIKTTYGKKDVMSCWWPDKPRESLMGVKFVAKGGEAPESESDCDFEQEDEKSWRCVTHDVVMVGPEPVTCTSGREVIEVTGG